MIKFNRVALRRSLYVFLVPLFFLLHGYNENFGLVPISTVLALGAKYFLIVLCIFFLSFLILRSIDKAASFTFYSSLIFFFFGAFHDVLKTYTKSFLQSYTFLLPFIAVLVLALFLILRFLRTVSRRTTSFLNFLFLFFIVWEVANCIYLYVSGKAAINDLAGEPITLSVPAETSLKNAPDIFLVVFDEYTSSSCLKEEFQYDNKKIDSLLAQNGFFTSYKSRSNYNMTPFSLASTLNGNYLRGGIESTFISNQVFSRAVKTMANGHIVYYFKEHGYEIKNYGCFNHELASTLVEPYLSGWDYNLIDNQVLSSRIVRDIGWNWILKDLSGSFRIGKQYYKSKTEHINRNTLNWNRLIQAVQMPSAKPRFVIAHLMLPHEPFYFDSTGQMISDTTVLKGNRTYKEAYLSQLKYANRLLEHLISISNKKADKPRVMIIEGDHGFRDYSPDVPREKVFRNLNSYYFSDGDYSMLYDGISPVNSFRVVLNKYFDQQLPLLRDSCIYLQDPPH